MPVSTQNVLLALGCAAIVALFWSNLQTDPSRRATKRLRRDKIGLISLVVVMIYVTVGLLDSFQFDRQTSLLDLAFRGIPQESGYSAPLAATTYNERKPEALK